MSQENVDLVRGVYDHFSATGTLDLERLASTFVVDMSNFEIWPEDHFYEGHDGAKEYSEPGLSHGTHTSTVSRPCSTRAIR
jgi:hypothetical protein